MTDGDLTMLSGKAFQVLITRLEKKLLSRAEYTCVLASFIELPLVRSIHEHEKSHPKVVSESRVTWATSVPIVFLGLSVLKLGPMYATDRRQTKASLNASALWGRRHKNSANHQWNIAAYRFICLEVFAPNFLCHIPHERKSKQYNICLFDRCTLQILATQYIHSKIAVTL